MKNQANAKRGWNNNRFKRSLLVSTRLLPSKNAGQKAASGRVVELSKYSGSEYSDNSVTLEAKRLLSRSAQSHLLMHFIHSDTTEYAPFAGIIQIRFDGFFSAERHPR